MRGPKILIILFPLMMMFSKTYYTSKSDTHSGINEYDIRTISELNELLLANFNSKPQIGIDDSVLFKRGERFFGQINLLVPDNENSVIADNIIFSDYGTATQKPIIDGSAHHFHFNASEFNKEKINGTIFYKYIIQTDVNGNIEGTSIPLPEKFINIYADETELILAREPELDEMGGGVPDLPHSISKDNSIPDDDILAEIGSQGYKGFYSIDHVTSETSFQDNYNLRSWNNAEIVIKAVQWSYYIKKIISNTPQNYILDSETANSLKASWGYYIQNHKDALDTAMEWFYQYDETVRDYKTLYFLPKAGVTECDIYMVAYDDNNLNSHGFGFNISNIKGCTIENLDFRNHHSNILVHSDRNEITANSNITINNNTMQNSVIGINYFYMSYSTIEGNIIKNIRSQGIQGSGNSNTIRLNKIENIGLTLGSDRINPIFYNQDYQFVNLNGIWIQGIKNIVGQNNEINNIGYCGIFLCSDRGLGREDNGEYVVDTNNIFDHNIIDNIGLSLADGGGIYSWKYFGKGNIIRNNIISNGKGNGNGTPNAPWHFRGIYFDQLSCNYKVHNNTIEYCGGGIYMQVSRNNEIFENTCRNNVTEQFFLNHGTTILNGGRHNENNSIFYNPLYDPESDNLIILDGSEEYPFYSEYPYPKSYYNNKYVFDPNISDRIMRYCYQNEDGTYSYSDEYVEFYPTSINGEIYGNKVYNNHFYAESSVSHLAPFEYFTIRFQTWRVVDEDILYNYTRNPITDSTNPNNAISDNLAEGESLDKVSLFISSSDVGWEVDNGDFVIDHVAKISLDSLDNNHIFNMLGKFRAKIIGGLKVAN